MPRHFKVWKDTSKQAWRCVSTTTTMAHTFTAALVMRAINSCRNKAFGPDNPGKHRRPANLQTVTIAASYYGCSRGRTSRRLYLYEVHPRCSTYTLLTCRDPQNQSNGPATVMSWVIGVNIPDIDVILNGYLGEMTAYLQDNSLLISSPTCSVTLLTRTHTKSRHTWGYSSRTHTSHYSNTKDTRYHSQT